MERNYSTVEITKKGERALRGGHPWVFEGEVTRTDADIADGALVDVLSDRRKYLGTGFYNSHSKIRVRVISRNPNDRFDAAFFERRLRYALDYRRQIMGADYGCCRLIFGEADMFPGLTVDRFSDILVAEVLSLGMEQRKEMLFDTLVRLLRGDGETIRALYERNESALREREGLEKGKGFYAGSGLSTELSGHTEITENGIRYDVDYINGQKTGFFLDQKYNRQAVGRIAPGLRVLDCFTHTGAFALNAAKAGAAHVTAVDVSADAIRLAEANAARNDLSGNMDFVCADVFDLLTALAEKKRSDYDFIVLDPPAFTKSSATVKNASRGYKEINLKAMRLLPRGGYLATCSCSHFMTDELFRTMLHDAAADAAVQLRQIEARQQSPDHPILWNVPETDYLKFYLFQVV